MFGIFSNKKVTKRNGAVVRDLYKVDFEEMEGKLLSRVHEEELRVLETSSDDFTFAKRIKSLRERIEEYYNKFHIILSDSKSKEFWVRQFVGTPAKNGKWGIENVQLGDYSPIIGVRDEYGNVSPFKVEYGMEGEKIHLRFISLDPWDEGTELEIRDEIDSLHLPFEVCC